jgi:hypothetical protein
MPSRAKEGGGEGLSLQTLVIAAGASAAAAVIVSHLWKDGTVIAAAMTPVIVAIVKELLAKPMESELVRKPVKQVSRVASTGGRRVAGSIGVRTGGVAPRSSSPPRVDLPEHEPQPRTAERSRGERHDGLPPTERADFPPTAGDAGVTPIRTYGRRPRWRRVHLKIAIVTGLVAFLIAAAALTLPELIFGGAISSHHDTTLFGGGSGSSKSDEKKDGGDKNGTTQPDDQSPSGQQTTTPATPPPTSGSTPRGAA